MFRTVCLCLSLWLAGGLEGRGSSHELVDWSTSQWFSYVDFALRAILSPQGLYGINKLIDIATHGTGVVNLNATFLNLTWHVEHTDFSLETIQVGDLNTVNGLEALQPQGRYGLASTVVFNNTSVSATVSVNRSNWLQFRAQTEGLSVAITAIVEAYEDELEAMQENQVMFSRCWNRTLQSLSVSTLHTRLLQVSSLALAASSWPAEVWVVNALLKELVKNDLFQHIVQETLNVESRKLQEGLNDDLDRMLTNSSKPACPEPQDKSIVDENRSSAFSWLPVIVGGVLLLYALLAVGCSRDKSHVSLRLAYSRTNGWVPTLWMSLLLAVTLALQLYTLQEAISTVSVDARVCQGNPCEPFPVVRMPVAQLNFSSLMRYFRDADAWLLAFAMLMCCCILPLGIQTLLLAVWWVPVAPKWLGVRRYMVVLACQTCRFGFATVVFQVYMICVLGSSSKMVLDDQSSFLQIKIQGGPEIAVYLVILSTLLTWVLCHATRRAHDSTWPRQEVDLRCCQSKRVTRRSPQTLILCMLLASGVATAAFVMGFFSNLVTYTTFGLLGLVESGDEPQGYVTHMNLLNLASRLTELAPEADKNGVLVMCAAYYLTMLVAPAVSLLLLFVLWGSAWGHVRGAEGAYSLHQLGSSLHSISWVDKQASLLEALAVCSSLNTLDALLAVTMGGALQMHLLFTQVVGSRLPFACTLWTSLAHSECVSLEGELQAGTYWLTAAWFLAVVLSVATEYCFLLPGAVGLNLTKTGYLPISTE